MVRVMWEDAVGIIGTILDDNDVIFSPQGLGLRIVESICICNRFDKLSNADSRAWRGWKSNTSPCLIFFFNYYFSYERENQTCMRVAR